MPFPGQSRGPVGRPVQQERSQQQNQQQNQSQTVRRAENLEGDAFPIAMAYVPWQCWTQIYQPEKALQRGTLFCQLDKPFTGRRNCGCN